jgi:23S rRNA pseudouridine955/2504/2580 synthase
MNKTSNEKKLIASKNDEGRIIFKFLINVFSDVPISRIEKIFRKNDIKINGKRKIVKNYKLQENDEIVVYGLESNPEVKIITAEINFYVVFEDDNILIVNKPSGIEMHDSSNSLDNQVKKYLDFVKTDSFVVSSIGRLDKLTSGIVIYAKTYKALRELKEKQGSFYKEYLIVSDLPKDITTRLYLKKDEKNQKIEVSKGVTRSLAITEFYIKRRKKFAVLKTGKKHQIRVSLAHLGYPIYGDKKYGGKNFHYFGLHSCKITFDDLEYLDYLNGKSFNSDPNW